MTRPKRPLPSLRFVVLQGYKELYRFIPQTTPKGRVLPDLWAIPGAEIRHTSELIDLCMRRGWRWRIEGDDGRRRSRRGHSRRLTTAKLDDWGESPEPVSNPASL